MLMVTKLRNLAIPKAKEEAGASSGNRMLKVSLTDGASAGFISSLIFLIYFFILFIYPFPHQAA